MSNKKILCKGNLCKENLCKENLCIVIARYNENLNWIKLIKNKNIKIIIYNKGLDDIHIRGITTKNIEIIKLPNIGRESHTYLYHIINNYNTLNDTTIFCQGDTIFHSPKFIDLIHYYKLFEPIQPLSAYYSGGCPNDCIPPLEITKLTKEYWIHNCPIHVEYCNHNFETVYPFYYTSLSLHNIIKSLLKDIQIENNLLDYFIDIFKLKNVKKNTLIPVSYAAIFAVHKNVILDNTIHFYKNILKVLLKNTTIDLGFFIERLWMTIFNYQKYNTNYKVLHQSEYKIFNVEQKIKDNNSHFTVFLNSSEIFIDIYIDKTLYYFAYLNTHLKIQNYTTKEKIIVNNVHIKKNKNIICNISVQNNTLIVFLDRNKIQHKIKEKNLTKIFVKNIYLNI
jgi:hypothetical protein